MIRPISEGDAWVTNDDGDIIGIQLHGRSEIVDLSNPVNGKVDPVTGMVEIPSVVAGRSAAQLAAAPAAADITLGDSTVFYDIADPTKRYAMSADHAAFVASGGSGGAVQIDLNGQKQIKVCWLGNSVIQNAGYMMDYLKRVSGGRLVTTKNGGVVGIGSAGVLAAIATNIDPDADLVVALEGANDASTNIGCAAHYANMKAIGEYCQAHGQMFMILASTPRDLAGTTVNKYTMKYPLTDWLVAVDLGALYCDPWRDMRDVSGQWPSGYSTDNTHPSIITELYGMAAKRIWAAIQSYAAGAEPVIEPLCDDENAGYSSVSNVGSASLTKGNALLQDSTAGWQLVDSANNTVTDANIALSTGSAAPFRGNELIIDFSAGINATRAIKRRFLISTSTNRPATTDEILSAVVARGTNLVNAKVQIYTYAPNGGWAAKTMMRSRKWDFEREYFSAGPFVAGGSGAAQEYSVFVEISQIDIGLPATGVVAISNCDIYNLTRLRSTQFGV